MYVDDKGKRQDQGELIVVNLETNVLQKGFFFSFARRNVIEALILSGAICYGISLIDFTNFVMGIHMAIYGLGTFFFVARGYKNRSFLQTAQDYVHTLKTRKQLHLRGPEYVRQDIRIQDGEDSNQSIAQQIAGKAGKKLNKFMDEYGETEVSE